MKIHEYQAKALLRVRLARSPGEAVRHAEAMLGTTLRTPHGARGAAKAAGR